MSHDLWKKIMFVLNVCQRAYYVCSYIYYEGANILMLLDHWMAFDGTLMSVCL